MQTSLLNAESAGADECTETNALGDFSLLWCNCKCMCEYWNHAPTYPLGLLMPTQANVTFMKTSVLKKQGIKNEQLTKSQKQQIYLTCFPVSSGGHDTKIIVYPDIECSS